MANATAKNEIQVILQEYLGRRKAVEAAEYVYAKRQTETQHTHHGKKCFVNEDSNGVLMLTKDSVVEECLRPFLFQRLERAEVAECLEQLMAVRIYDLAEHSQTNNVTAKNEIRVILQKHLKRRKAAEVVEYVYAAMQTETLHTHNGKTFFIHENPNGALMLTRVSMAKKRVEAILSQNLEKDEIQECLVQLMKDSISNEIDITKDIETISIEGSDSHIYLDLLSENLRIEPYQKKNFFLYDLRFAIKAGVKPFKVPVCDPSINENGCLQFVAGCKPAVGYSYNEVEKLAISHGMKIGTKNQYTLFIATIIHCLIKEGWSADSAFYLVLTDSTRLGHYCDSENAQHRCELTGSRKIAGKCDLANTQKILAKEKDSNYVWCASGSYANYGNLCPIGYLGGYEDKERTRCYEEKISFDDMVGWFVL